MNKESDLELDVVTSEPEEEDEARQGELPEEDKESEEPDKKEESYQRRVQSFLIGFVRKKRLILSVTVLVLAVVVVSAFFLFRLPFFGEAFPTASEDLVVPDDFHEQKLAPFFIPLSEGGAGKMAVVAPVALWDELTSLRFQRKEHQIRNRLYEFLVHFEEGGGNLEKKISTLQSRMSNIVRESLGIEDLTIRVREVKIY